MNSLLRNCLCGLCILSLALSAGCLPREMVFWSPDGQVAAVTASAGMFFVDGEGKILGKTDITASGVSWFEDSNRLAIAQNKPIDAWSQLQPYMSQENQKQVMKESAELLDEIRSLKGNIENWQPQGSYRDIVSDLIYLKDTHSQELQGLLGEKWKEIQEASRNVSTLHTYRVESGRLLEGRRLLVSLNTIQSVRVSPDGKAIAYTTENPKPTGKDADQQSDFTLWVVRESSPFASTAPEGKVPLQLAGHAGMYFDWFADSKRLAYVNHPSESREISTIEVIEAAAAAIASGGQPSTAQPSKVLARAITPPGSPIAVMADDKIVFVSGQMTLPAADDAEPICSLFAVDAEGKNLTVLREAKNQEDSIVYHVARSGDRKRIAFQQGKRLGVTDTSGKAVMLEQQIQIEGRNLTPAIPAWRGSNEITFQSVAKVGRPDRAELYMWSPDKSEGNTVRCISEGWPDELVKGLLWSPPQTADEPGSGQAATAPGR